MNPGELITFCLLSGNVKMNKQLTTCNGELSDEYVIRMMYQTKEIMFRYHKDGDNITFVKGSKIEIDPVLGVGLSEICSFADLMETLKIVL